MYPSEERARELVCAIGRKLYQREYVAGSDGNISIRTGANEVVVTPTGVCKGDMTPDTLLRVDLDGRVLSGPGAATSELPMHLRIYREAPEMCSTVHAHSIHLSCLAVLGAELDLPLTTATAAVAGRVPVAPFCNPGSQELADAVAPYVRDYNLVLLANHGPIAWGRTPEEAQFVLEEAEHFAKLALLQKYVVGAWRPLSHPQLVKMAATHGIELPPSRQVRAPQTTDNTTPAVPLSTLETAGVHLDDSSIQRLADALADRLTGVQV